MKIQLITGNKTFAGNDQITISDYSHPMSPDDFDINVIDLSYKNIWRHGGNQIGPISIYDDLRPISKMIGDSSKSKTVYVYPQDGDFLYYYDGKQYKYRSRIKNLISNENYNLGYESCFSMYAPQLHVVFEPTKTIIKNIEYAADFRFAFDIGTIITKSESSGKTTTIKTEREYYFTTLDICSSLEKLMLFLEEYLVSVLPDVPDWVKTYEFWNDADSKATIESNKKQIFELNQKIEDAETILNENNRYKSILSTNGDELVEVVFEILEKMLNCTLSDFIDEKKEDFRIEKNNHVFIGEIKGINTNVKNENVSQLDVHYQSYLDEEKNDKTNVHAILIINPQRNRSNEERDPVGEQQIKLAKRNESLIIETITLLKVFELFLDGKLSSERIVEVLASKVGILKIEDFQVD